MWTLPLQWPDPVADSREFKRSRNLDTIFRKSLSTCRAKFDFRCHRVYLFFFNLSIPFVHCSSSPWGVRITRQYFGLEGVTWVRPHEIPPVFHTLVSNPMEKESKAKRTEGTWLCVYWEHALWPAEPLWEFLRLSCVFLDGGQVAIQSGWMDGTPVERYHQSVCPSLPSQGFRFPPLGIPARQAEVSEETALLSWQTWPPVVTTHNSGTQTPGRKPHWASSPRLTVRSFFFSSFLFIYFSLLSALISPPSGRLLA